MAAKKRRNLDYWESVFDKSESKPAPPKRTPAISPVTTSPLLQDKPKTSTLDTTKTSTTEDEIFWEQLIEAEFGVQTAPLTENELPLAETNVPAVSSGQAPTSTRSSRRIVQEGVVLSVSAFIQQINIFLEDGVGRASIQGEISNLATPRSGHYYFSLKDRFGVLAAVMFRSAHEQLDFRLRDGMEVVCRGQMSLYELRGKLQMVVEHMELVGIGKLAVAFEHLKEKLKAEGLFELEHKRPLPFLPRKIGLITSATGAAVRDLMQVLERRCPSCSLLLAHCQVQGNEAAGDIVAAIKALNERDDIDLIILGRGGGSLEDLWPFNEEPVVRAVFHSRIPIVTGVGHETDTTMVDFVADLRAPTPSAAAELAVPEERELRLRLQQLHRRLELAIQRRLQESRLLLKAISHEILAPQAMIERQRRVLEQQRQKLHHELRDSLLQHRRRLLVLQARLERRDPVNELRQLRKQLENLAHRLQSLGSRIPRQKREQLFVTMRRLHDLSPLRVLERGFALVLGEEGEVLRDAKEIEPGQALQIRLHKGTLQAEVKKSFHHD